MRPNIVTLMKPHLPIIKPTMIGFPFGIKTPIDPLDPFPKMKEFGKVSVTREIKENLLRWIPWVREIILFTWPIIVFCKGPTIVIGKGDGGTVLSEITWLSWPVHPYPGGGTGGGTFGLTQVRI